MKVAVVGLGYVGLPLLIRLSQLHFNVLGVDINSQKINKLQKGLLPFAQMEPSLPEFFRKEYTKGKLIFSTSFEKLKERDLIFVCVDTPIVGGTPKYQSLTKALGSIGNNLKKSSTVIIESTVAPNTGKNIVTPILEKQSKLKVNQDFYVATVPERIRPNHIFEQLTTLSRVIGVSDEKIMSKLKEVYSQITSGEINLTDLTTAETVKTVENSYRDVNIAFANEVALACEELGVNVWEVRKLVNKSPFHNMHEPGAGVGGHCIPKDPWLLVSSVKKHQMRLVKTARAINDNMPSHVFTLLQGALKKEGINIASAKAAILGYSYVGNSDDTRNSPTETLLKILQSKKIKYTVHDPLVKEFSNHSIVETVRGADILIFMVEHDVYKQIDYKKIAKLMKTKIIIDGRNIVDPAIVKRLKFMYKAVGNTLE